MATSDKSILCHVAQAVPARSADRLALHSRAVGKAPSFRLEAFLPCLLPSMGTLSASSTAQLEVWPLLKEALKGSVQRLPALEPLMIQINSRVPPLDSKRQPGVSRSALRSPRWTTHASRTRAHQCSAMTSTGSCRMLSMPLAMVRLGRTPTTKLPGPVQTIIRPCHRPSSSTIRLNNPTATRAKINLSEICMVLSVPTTSPRTFAVCIRMRVVAASHDLTLVSASSRSWHRSLASADLLTKWIQRASCRSGAHLTTLNYQRVSATRII